MIDINLKGLLYVTRAVLPLMLERQRGHILNIGSIAGIDAYENGNVYCASKAAVDMLSKTMRIDLHRNNIKVSEVKPGMVETEFSLVRFKGDAERAEKVYAGYTPLSAEDVADLIAFIVTRPPHVNIADTLILPSAQAKSGMVHKVLN
jgi:NADP-dependent 3-hydroxy acid dehydrogenase YdfG